MSSTQPNPPQGTNPVPPTTTVNPSQVTNTVTVPSNPVMGTYIETYIGSGVWNCLVGGKPMHDWSGLDSKAKRGTTPYHLRPLDLIKDAKGFTARKTGFITKFSRDSSLPSFASQVWKHLVSHGLDTIAYLPDPSDNGSVLDVVKIIHALLLTLTSLMQSFMIISSFGIIWTKQMTLQQLTS